MTAPEVIDRAALASLLETVGDDPEFLGELIDSYFEDTAVLLVSMRQAATAADTEALRRASHSLKSNSATFGATRLAGLCQRLEALARDGDLTEAGDQLAEVEAEYGRVQPALEAARQGT
jgi:HPt (histidine-containing phosphotransfer) domain-containing protein